MGEEKFFGYPSKKEQEAAVQRVCKFLDEKDGARLRDQIEYLEKLKHLTLEMKRKVLQQFSPQSIGQAFKLAHRDLVTAFLQDLSSTLKAEILHSLQEKISIGKMMKVQEDLIDYCRKQEAKGRFILNSNDKLV